MKNWRLKNLNGRELVENLLALYQQKNEKQHELQSCQSEMNSLSKQIGMLFKDGKVEEANAAKSRTAQIKASIKTSSEVFAQIDEQVNEILLQLPNIPNDLVKPGSTEEDNEIVDTWGEMPELCEGAVEHWELTSKYDIIDFELGTKITGAGFPVYKGKGARFQRALINFFLDEARDAGYLEIMPPCGCE